MSTFKFHRISNIQKDGTQWRHSKSFKVTRKKFNFSTIYFLHESKRIILIGTVNAFEFQTIAFVTLRGTGTQSRHLASSKATRYKCNFLTKYLPFESQRIILNGIIDTFEFSTIAFLTFKGTGTQWRHPESLKVIRNKFNYPTKYFLLGSKRIILNGTVHASKFYRIPNI